MYLSIIVGLSSFNWSFNLLMWSYLSHLLAVVPYNWMFKNKSTAWLAASFFKFSSLNTLSMISLATSVDCCEGVPIWLYMDMMLTASCLLSTFTPYLNLPTNSFWPSSTIYLFFSKSIERMVSARATGWAFLVVTSASPNLLWISFFSSWDSFLRATNANLISSNDSLCGYLVKIF